MDLKQIKKIHFIGIGGIGMSALARIMLINGKIVRGSDREASIITDELEKMGADIFIKHSANNLETNTDLVIYTTAIDASNIEFRKARRYGIKTLTYSQFLGELTKNKFTIAISGTHGKTTTTAMIGLILTQAGFDPSVVVGSQVKDFKGNARVGQGKYMVVEACEHRAAFLDLKPKIIVLTNIEADHLDYYKNLKNLKKTFHQYIEKLPANGWAVANCDDENIKEILKDVKIKKIWYGLGRGRGYTADQIKLDGQGGQFILVENKKIKGQIKLNVLGKHNIYNALAAAALADQLKIDFKFIQQALNKFSGTWRRFETRQKVFKSGIIIIDDYAHHPTEIRATLEAAKIKYPNKKIWAVFQPHLYSRTQFLFNDFAQAFSLADQVIIIDIYAAREANPHQVSSQNLVQAIQKYQKNAIFIPSINETENYLKKNLKSGDLVLILGAGDIYKLKV